MRGRGNGTIDLSWLRHPWSVVLVSSLMLAWPFMGGGKSGGGEREAMSFAWHVEASATLVAGPRPC
jgi:hypothetical protein